MGNNTLFKAFIFEQKIQKNLKKHICSGSCLQFYVSALLSLNYHFDYCLEFKESQIKIEKQCFVVLTLLKVEMALQPQAIRQWSNRFTTVERGLNDLCITVPVHALWNHFKTCWIGWSNLFCFYSSKSEAHILKCVQWFKAKIRFLQKYPWNIIKLKHLKSRYYQKFQFWLVTILQMGHFCFPSFFIRGVTQKVFFRHIFIGFAWRRLRLIP